MIRDRSMKVNDQWPPLAEVRKDLRVEWYRCPIAPAKLRELMRRSDRKGWFQAGGHLALFACTAALVILFWSQQLWFLVRAGAVRSRYDRHLLPRPGDPRVEPRYGISHQVAQQAVPVRVRAAELGQPVPLRREPHLPSPLHPASGGRPRGGAAGQRVVAIPPDAAALHLQRNGAHAAISAPAACCRSCFDTVQAAFGVVGGEWWTAMYADQPQEKRKAIWWARAILAFHGAIVLVAILSGLWVLPVVLSLFPFIGNWWAHFVGLPMHAGLRDNVTDFRKCVRSITLDPFSEFMYWHKLHTGLFAGSLVAPIYQ